jgi:hypothetical protein
MPPRVFRPSINTYLLVLAFAVLSGGALNNVRAQDLDTSKPPAQPWRLIYLSIDADDEQSAHNEETGYEKIAEEFVVAAGVDCVCDERETSGLDEDESFES